MGGVLVQVDDDSVSGLARAFAAIVENKDLNDHKTYEIGVPVDKSTKKPSIRIEAASDAGGKNDLSLTLVIRTAVEIPPVRHRIGDDVVSILFEQ